MKPVLKDAQTTLRLNSELLEAMKTAAAKEKLSLADYVSKIFIERQKNNDLAERVEKIERVLFHQAA